MQIIEIFQSIQGESSYAGLPCVFVRLAGCNLRCRWCDSAYSFADGRKMSGEEICNEVRRLASAGQVEFTGGEPMLQARDLLPCMHQLLQDGYELLLETNGACALEAVPAAVHKIVDVKCPSSGEHDSFRESNLATLASGDELKFVLATRADYDYARQFIRDRRLEASPAELLLSPAFHPDAQGTPNASHYQLDPRLVVDWMLADALRARLSLQIHKFIWPPEQRGV